MLDIDVTKKRQELHAAVIDVFGGIGAISRDFYEEALRQVAKRCGRIVDDEFRVEVVEELYNIDNIADSYCFNRVRHLEV